MDGMKGCHQWLSERVVPSECIKKWNAGSKSVVT